MGQCSSTPGSYPTPITLQDLANTAIGETYESPNGCGPNISGTQAGSGYAQLISKGFSWPNNGEFVWGGLGSACGLCSDVPSYGCGCSGSGAISGSHGTVKRVAYNGNVNNCCTSQNQLDGNNTCDPKYLGYNNNSCDASMTTFCAQGDNIKTNQNCINWASKNPTAAQNVMINYCGSNNNLNTDFCQSFAYQNSGAADDIVSKYCSNNPNDTTFCGCYNIPSSLTGLGLKPQCNIQSCVAATAYKSKAMLADTSCPTVNLCLQTLNIPTVDQSQITGGINFSCTNTSQTNSTTKTNTISSSSATTSLLDQLIPNSSSSSSSSSIFGSLGSYSIYIIIAIVIIIAFLSSSSLLVLS